MGGANQLPDSRPVQASGQATGYYELPSTVRVANDSDELTTILLRLRTDPTYNVRTVQLLGNVLYDISAITLDYQAMADGGRYLLWPNIVCLNGAATIVMLGEAETVGGQPLYLVPLLSDSQVSTMENVYFQVNYVTPADDLPSIVYGPLPTLDLGYTRAMVELRRVRGNLNVSFETTFSGTPDVILTVEECVLEQLLLSGTAGANVRNSTLVSVYIKEFPSTLQLSWNLDNCTLTGKRYTPNGKGPQFRPPVEYDRPTATSNQFLTLKTCRIFGEISTPAVIITQTGTGGGVVLQNCTFDWTFATILDLANSGGAIVNVFLLGVWDLQASGVNKMTESGGGVVGSLLRVGVTNLVPANFAGVTVATKDAALLG